MGKNSSCKIKGLLVFYRKKLTTLLQLELGHCLLIFIYGKLNKLNINKQCPSSSTKRRVSFSVFLL